ncbi:MAG: metallopeptidase family protein [Microbacteriaceae bacterium]
MPRTRHSAPARASRRNRHRGVRSPVTGPYLPQLNTRLDFFDNVVASTAEYLREVWPQELESISFEVAALPAELSSAAGVDRWKVIASERRIILYRLPIQRLTKLHRNDEWHRRAVIESCVFRAVAEMLGKDPWELAPGRFMHF